MEELIGELLKVLVWLILWPAVLVLATPLVAVYAATRATRQGLPFLSCMTKGYGAVSDLWQKLL
jgi:cation transport ATPase